MLCFIIEMEIVDTYELYIKRRQEGETVLSSAYIYGLAAANLTKDPFTVLDIKDDSFSLFLYIRDSNGRFAVTRYHEKYRHELRNVIDDSMKVAATQWWNIVFCERDGMCLYDKYYDNLPIFNGTKMTFKELLQQLKDEITKMSINFDTGKLFLTGIWSDCRPLRWAFQLKYGTEVAILPQIELSKSKQDVIVKPEEKLSNSVLRVAGGIPLNILTEQKLQITFPLCCYDKEALEKIKWSSLISTDMPEYSINVDSEPISFKRLSVVVEYDVFGNVFLECSDMYGSRRSCCLEMKKDSIER